MRGAVHLNKVLSPPRKCSSHRSPTKQAPRRPVAVAGEDRRGLRLILGSPTGQAHNSGHVPPTHQDPPRKGPLHSAGTFWFGLTRDVQFATSPSTLVTSLWRWCHTAKTSLTGAAPLLT